MALAKILSRASMGIEAPLVTVETHLSSGLPALHIVGLPETTVRESKERVRSALINCGFNFPARRITINLAPADLPKEGSRFDLAIAIGILAASQQIPEKSVEGIEFIGELALSGELRPVPGILPAAIQCSFTENQLMIPAANAEEASLSDHHKLFAANNLPELTAHLNRIQLLTPYLRNFSETTTHPGELAEVIGQQQAKRALEIAASGQHNLLFYGPPGTGKTLIASKLPTILPKLSLKEALEIAAIYSISARNIPWFTRPFRSPHHTASSVALVGGGSKPKPGEISLAHHGVLFLDELPEFDRKVLEVMREPMESGEIHISRANHQVCYPARFQLIAAMNPCPCGYFGDKEKSCRCTPDQILRYRHKISGPLLDRIDMQVEVCRETFINQATPTSDNSQTIRQRVQGAHQKQLARQGKSNADLEHNELKKFCRLSQQQKKLLDDAIKQFTLSARASMRILRVSLSIADLDNSEIIEDHHLLEALAYRQLEKSSNCL